MFKTELKDFNIESGDYRFSAAAPISLFAAFKENGVIENPYYRDEEEKRFSPLCNAVVISASFMLSRDAAKLKYAYLKIPELDTSAEIVVNGTAAFKVVGRRAHKLDVSGIVKEGENTFSIYISASDEPRDITLFDNVEFFAFSRAHIGSVSAKPIIGSDSISVDVALEILGDKEDIKAVATLVSPTGKIYYGGVINGRTVINVPDPLLWWPLGYGVQNLYKLGVNLYYENEAIDSADVKVGLRSVFRDGREDAGFTVNGTEFFAMGAEYKMNGKTPSYNLFSRAKTLLPSVAGANMNFIRFKGFGRYPTDVFLDLCDTYGIALEYVIGGENILSLDESTLRRELAYNLKRMSKHPSLFSVCYDKTKITPERAAIIDEAKNAALSSVFVRETDSDESFFATVSIPEKKTLLAISEKEDMNLFSYVMEHHEESPEDTSKMLSAAASSYKYAHGMDELTYMSCILNAHACENFVHKRRAERSKFGAAVISSLGDPKPSISHGLIDYDGRFKSTYYLAKQFFAPIRLIVNKTDKFAASFVLSNESKKSFSGLVEYSIKDAHNNVIYSSSLKLGADKNSSAKTESIDFSEHVSGHERECYLEYILYNDSARVYSGSYLFVAPKHFNFTDPVILSEIGGSGREFTLTVKASGYAKDVFFRFENIDAVFEENCIDITEKGVKRIAFVTSVSVSVERLMSELRVMSVYNIGREN